MVNFFRCHYPSHQTMKLWTWSAQNKVVFGFQTIYHFYRFRFRSWFRFRYENEKHNNDVRLCSHFHISHLLKWEFMWRWLCKGKQIPFERVYLTIQANIYTRFYEFSVFFFSLFICRGLHWCRFLSTNVPTKSLRNLLA